jgi:hypothetical protein
MDYPQSTFDKIPAKPLTPKVLLNFVTVALMMTCLAIAMERIIQRVIGLPNSGFLPVLTFLVALEALFSHRRLEQFHLGLANKLAWRLSELVVLAVITRVTFYLLLPAGQWIRDLANLQTRFVETFFVSSFTVVFSALLLFWLIATTFADVLHELEENHEQWDLEMQGLALRDRDAVRGRLVSHVFGFGAALMVIIALLNLDLLPLPGQPVALSALTVDFVAYFVLGLLLLAQSQYALQSSHWYLQRVPSQPAIFNRWIRFSALLVVGLAMLVFLLPTQYSVGLLDLLRGLFNILMAIGLLLQFLIFTPILLLISFFSRLFGGSGIGLPAEPIEPQIPLETLTNRTYDWAEILQSVLFWTLFLGVLVFAFRFYLRQHSEALAPLRKLGIVRWFRQAWEWLQRLLGRTGAGLGQTLRGAFDRLQASGQAWLGSIPNRFPALDQLAPRQQILLTYLGLVSWMKQKGVERKAASTPLEYAGRLVEFLPEAAAPLEDITRQFMEARYTRHAITPQESARTRAQWEQVQAIYRQKQAQKRAG